MFASIFKLELAAGIKDALFSHGFASIDAILKMPPAELAIILGIDLYIARIIYLAAKRHKQIEDLNNQINEEKANTATSKKKN